jgi:hypothetical protein
MQGVENMPMSFETMQYPYFLLSYFSPDFRKAVNAHVLIVPISICEFMVSLGNQIPKQNR